MATLKEFSFWIIVFLIMMCVSCKHRQSGLAEYHEALALADRGDAPAALEKLGQAAKLATTDSLQALIKSQMGTLFFNQHLLDRSLACYRQAYQTDLRARDTVGLIYDLRDIGNIYRTGEHADSCLLFFEQARDLAIKSGNLPMQRDVESQMAAYYLNCNLLDSARHLLQPALAYMDSTNQSGLTFMLADLYHRSHQPDSAIIYYRKLLECGSLHARMGAHRVLAEYAVADGDIAQAKDHLAQYELLTDSVLTENDSESLRRMTALYDYTHHQQQSARLHNRLILAVAVIGMLGLAWLATFFYIGRRQIYYQLKLAQLERLLEKYRQQAADQQEDIKRSAISLHIEQLLTDVSQPVMTQDDWHELEATINQLNPDFLKKLRTFCRLTSLELHVCLLLKLKVPPVGIAQLTAHSKQAITNLRSRLYAKTFGQKGTPTQWDEFVWSL